MSPTAAADVLEQHRPELLRFGTRYCGNHQEAEDAVQDAYFVLLRPTLTSVNRTLLWRVVRFVLIERDRRAHTTRSSHNGPRIRRESALSLDLATEGETPIDVAASYNLENAAIADIYVTAAVELCPEIPALLDAPELPAEGRGGRPLHIQRDRAWRRNRERLHGHLEQYIIDSYFGGEHRGNDRAERY